jgi:hypothetical protein
MLPNETRSQEALSSNEYVAHTQQIFVAEPLFDDGESDGPNLQPSVDTDHLSAEELQRHLAQLRPEDFGRFTP